MVPSLASAYGAHAAMLSSLTEVQVIDVARSNTIIAKANLDMEPQFLHLGPMHFAIGMNNSIQYYRYVTEQEGRHNSKNSIKQVCKREYFGSIKQVCMNELWTAVLAEGKVTLHMIEDSSQPDIKFPMQQGEKQI